MFLEQQILKGKIEARKYVMRVAIEKALKAHRTVLDRTGECNFSIDHSKDPLLEEVIEEFLGTYEITVVMHMLGETHLSVRRSASAQTREVLASA